MTTFGVHSSIATVGFRNVRALQTWCVVGNYLVWLWCQKLVFDVENIIIINETIFNNKNPARLAQSVERQTLISIRKEFAI